MPKVRQSKVKDTSDVFRTLSQSLREAVARPNINKYVPHHKQLLFHESKAKGKLFIGGNRSGKTVGGGAEMVMRMRKKHPYRPDLNSLIEPFRGRICTVDLVQGLEKIVLPEIARWMPKSDLINGSWEDSYDKATRTLTIENGSWVEFMTYEQDIEKFAGTSRHGIWFDEEPPKYIWDECRARLIDTNGDWWITMTPVEGLTWTFETVYQPALRGEHNYFVVEIEMDENPHLGHEEIEQYFSGMDESDKKARRKGQYIPTGGFIYANFISEANWIDPVIPPVNWLHFAGMDHGFTNPTAWLWSAVNAEGFMVVYHEHYESNQLVNYHAKEVLRTNKELNRQPAYYVGDPSIRNIDPITGTSVHLEYAEHGVPIVLGNNDQKAGIQRVSRLLKGIEVIGEDGATLIHRPKLYVTKDCPNLISELKMLRWAVWRDKKSQYEKNKKEEQQKKDDHAADALRYSVSSRPELDSGTEIPNAPVFNDASEAVSAQGPARDRELVSQGNQAYDDHLGSDW